MKIVTLYEEQLNLNYCKIRIFKYLIRYRDRDINSRLFFDANFQQNDKLKAKAS
jgi:hypothetical protein